MVPGTGGGATELLVGVGDERCWRALIGFCRQNMAVVPAGPEWFILAVTRDRRGSHVVCGCCHPQPHVPGPNRYSITARFTRMTGIAVARGRNPVLR
ncbi:hypothetical protein ACFFX0_27065 [Citricoccus parietis]|uniref:Uncharacterized protein n=1 Tax=Citricoccus parietis TaxID=592307 RepID=A0ABV5G6S3_9MICC